MRSLLAVLFGTLFVVIAGLATSDVGSAAFMRTAGQGTLAQAPPAPPADQPAISSQRTINLTEEDRHTIREIVLKDLNVRKEADSVQAAIGDPTPQGVATYEFPAQIASKIPALKSHTYFVKGDEVVVVDSKAGKIADIVK